MNVRALSPLPHLLLVMTVFGCGGDPEGAKQQYLSKGNSLLKSANYQEAAIEFRNALRIDGRFGLARFGLAQALDRSGNRVAARGEYVRAADLLPSDAAAQVAAARALLGGGAGQAEDARARVEAALRLDPKNAEAHLIRGRIAAGLDSFDDALKAFEAGILADPGRSDLYVNLGQLKSVQGNSTEAEASFKQAIIVAPDSVDARLSLADFYWYSGRLPEAERTLLEAVRLDKDSGRADRMLAAFYLSNKRAGDAEEPLKRAAGSADLPQMRMILADYYIGTGRYDAALPLLMELSKQPASYVFAKIRHAQMEFVRNRKVEAYSIVDELIAKRPDSSDALLAKGSLLLSDQKYDAAMTAFEGAVKIDPRSFRAQESLGVLHVRQNRWEEAERALSEALRLNPQSVRAQLALVDTSLMLGRPAEAVRYAESALRVQPSNETARSALARAALASGDTARARTELAAISTQSAQAQTLRGQLESRAGNLNAARKAFETAMEIDPSSTEALAGLVGVDMSEKRFAEAVTKVERHLASAPSASTLYLAARTYAAVDRMSEAEVSAQKALSLDPSLRPVYDLLGGLYRQQNKLPEAQKMYEKLSADRPNDVPANTMVGTLHVLQGNMGKARERFERVLSIDPRAAIASNNLAYMDAESGTNLDVALSRAQTAKAALPDDPEVNDTLGWVYVKRGLPTLAVPPLDLAIQKDPKNPLYYYHLGTAYAKAGDKDRARPALQKALQLSSSFPGATEAKQALATLGQ